MTEQADPLSLILDALADRIAERVQHRHPPDPELLAYTLPKAAKLVSMDVRRLRTAVDRGELPVRKSGSRTVVSRAALEAWLLGASETGEEQWQSDPVPLVNEVFGDLTTPPNGKTGRGARTRTGTANGGRQSRSKESG